MLAALALALSRVDARVDAAARGAGLAGEVWAGEGFVHDLLSAAACS